MLTPMTFPQSYFGLNPNLDPNSAAAQTQLVQATTLANMQQAGYPTTTAVDPYASTLAMNSMPATPDSPTALTPAVLKLYVGPEGIGGPAQAAKIALQAWQNGDIAVAQFFAKLVKDSTIARLISGQDGDTSSISWLDLSKLAKGKGYIGKYDIGAAPELTEALKSDLIAAAGLDSGAAQQNQWDPYGTMAMNSSTAPYPAQPAVWNGINGNVTMMSPEQAQMVQQSGQGIDLSSIGNTLSVAGLGGFYNNSVNPLMVNAGLASANGLQQPVASIPAATSFSYSNNPLPSFATQYQPSVQPTYIPPTAYQQPPSPQPMVSGFDTGRQTTYAQPTYPNNTAYQSPSVYPQQPVASMGSMTVPGTFRLVLMPA
jgi:hypothetical protein